MSTADIQILTSEYHSTLKRTRTLANWLIPGVGQVKYKMRVQYLPVVENKKMLKERQRCNRTTQERWSPTDQIWDNLAIEILLSNGSELSKNMTARPNLTEQPDNNLCNKLLYSI